VNKVSVAAAKALQAVWTGKEKPSKELAYHLHLFNKTVTRLLNERNEEQYVLLTFAEVAKRLDPTWWKSSSQGEQKKRLERMGHWARAVRNASACFTWIGIPMSKESAKGLPKVFSYLAEGDEVAALKECVRLLGKPSVHSHIYITRDKDGFIPVTYTNLIINRGRGMESQQERNLLKWKPLLSTGAQEHSLCLGDLSKQLTE
jgi:hypothetical protein